MFDGILLKEKIQKSGLSFKNLSCVLGMNCATLYRKVNGKTEFTCNEICDIIHCLDLTEGELQEIFFS